MTRGIALGVAAAFLVLAIAIGIVARASHERASQGGSALDADALRGTPVDPPTVARDFTLSDANGRARHLIVPNARATMLFFGYTHCPDACPLALASLGKAYRTLDAARAARVRVVFVTVDPQRDTPSVLRAYARGFDPHVVALTASPERLAEVWKAYGVRVDRATREIAHGDVISAIDGNARVVAVYPSDAPAADLAADMRALTR
ncbi:MAG: hypothetical protein NVS2B3_11910 [Vulcanimicrobiaceae bacterium]